MMQTTPGGVLLVLVLVVPVLGKLLAFALGGQRAEQLVLAMLPIGVALALAIMIAVLRADAPMVYLVGG